MHTERTESAGKHRWRSSDRKSTRLNSSHRCISYAVFCLKKKTRTFIVTRVVVNTSILVSMPTTDGRATFAVAEHAWNAGTLSFDPGSNSQTVSITNNGDT